MKEKTILSFIETLKAIKDSGLSISAYCSANDIKKQSIYDRMHEYRRTMDHSTESYNEVVNLYNSIVNKNEQYDKIESEEPVSVEEVESLNATEVGYERNSDGKIVYYTYKIYRKNKTPLIGKLSREEMFTVYRLYSYYGVSLTQREIVRHFPDLSLVDFKRILSAFGIYKASSPFPPHMIEELSIDELRAMQSREKENDFMRKAEEDAIRDTSNLCKKYAKENIELKKQLTKQENLSFKVLNIPDCPAVEKETSYGRSLNLYLADMHVGAAVESGTLYDENKNYGMNEVYRRLHQVAARLETLGKVDRLNVCLMGDMMDCCGPANMTNRLDHYMPENMDGFEQANVYISVMMKFVEQLKKLEVAPCIRFYSVRCGNHTGAFEYVATKALFAALNSLGYETVLFDTFLGKFEEGVHSFYLTHGKDQKFMKRGLPLNLDDKSRGFLYEVLDNNNEQSKNVHIIKGDLHSSAYSSCFKFDYRNVLSLYGASDYSAFNFSRNSYGVSYDIIQGDNILRGEFQNF
jgi:predicted DNA-binding protein YlxM (UPF0122 family)